MEGKAGGNGIVMFGIFLRILACTNVTDYVFTSNGALKTSLNEEDAENRLVREPIEGVIGNLVQGVVCWHS